jgi:hypothetical protein
LISAMAECTNAQDLHLIYCKPVKDFSAFGAIVQ